MHIRPSYQKGTHMLCDRLEAVCLRAKLFFFFIPTIGSSERPRPPPRNASPLLILQLMRCCGRWRDLRRTRKPDFGRGLLSVRSGMTHLCLSVHAGLRQRHRLCVCVYVYKYFACTVVRGINDVCPTTPLLCFAGFWHPTPNRRLMFCHQKVATYFRNALAACPPRIH